MRVTKKRGYFLYWKPGKSWSWVKRVENPKNLEKLIFCLCNQAKKKEWKFKLQSQTDLQIKGSCCCRQPKAAIQQIKANNGRGGGHGHDGGRWSHPQEAAFVPHDDELGGGAVFVVAIIAPAHRNDVAVAPAQSQLGPVGSMRVLGEGWVQKACSVGPSKTAATATTEDDGNNVLSALSTKSARFVSFCF